MQPIEQRSQCGQKIERTGIEAMSASTTAGVTQACASHHREAEDPSNRVDKITGIAACEDQYPRTRPQKQKCPAGTEQIFSIICRALVHSLYPEKQCSRKYAPMCCLPQVFEFGSDFFFQSIRGSLPGDCHADSSPESARLSITARSGIMGHTVPPAASPSSRATSGPSPGNTPTKTRAEE